MKSQKAKSKGLRAKEKHTTVGIRSSSPTELLIYRSTAYVQESGRDPQFSVVYGRMWKKSVYTWLYTNGGGRISAGSEDPSCQLSEKGFRPPLFWHECHGKGAGIL